MNIVLRRVPFVALMLAYWLIFGCVQNKSHSVGNLPVFPGAQGFGAMTPAGRGGQILKVVNRHDSGAGSLRAAIDAAGPRIIVFEVSGTILLSRDLVIRNPYLTIAGQSAPSPGITLRGAGIAIRSHDVLIQHLRVRVGDEPGGQSYPSRDAVSIIGPVVKDVIVDHVSASWAIDENLSMWFPVRNVTVSNSIISEGLHRSHHNKGPHSKGVLIGNHARDVVLTRNFITHNHDRYPLIKGDSSVILLNNLNYNSGTDEYVEIEDSENFGPNQVAVVGNVYTNGRDTPADTVMIKIHRTVKAGSAVFFHDNIYPGVKYRIHTPFDPQIFTAPLWDPSLQALPADQVEDRVLACAGARPADRDQVDRRLIMEYEKRAGHIIDSQHEIGGWPVLAEERRSFTLPDNHSADDDGDGYTNIEELLQQMAAEVEGRSCFFM